MTDDSVCTMILILTKSGVTRSLRHKDLDQECHVQNRNDRACLAIIGVGKPVGQMKFSTRQNSRSGSSPVAIEINGRWHSTVSTGIYTTSRLQTNQISKTILPPHMQASIEKNAGRISPVSNRRIHRRKVKRE